MGGLDQEPMALIDDLPPWGPRGTAHGSTPCGVQLSSGPAHLHLICQVYETSVLRLYARVLPIPCMLIYIQHWHHRWHNSATRIKQLIICSAIHNFKCTSATDFTFIILMRNCRMHIKWDLLGAQIGHKASGKAHLTL